MTSSRALFIMARQPTPGTTKTRLCPPLSPEEAAALYACFLADVIGRVRAAAGQLNGLVPGLAFTPPYATAHFAALDDPAVDVVLGPCDDGGYYLIGWKRPHPPLVREVTMSAPDTLAQTLAVAARDGLRVALLPLWYDVDGPADLARLADDAGLGDHTRAFLAQ